MIELVDTHCHLDFKHYDADREKVIENCKRKLKAVINSGTNFSGNLRTLGLAKDHPGFIYPTLGLHPTYLDDMNQLDIEKIKTLIERNANAIVAVGEIGIDYFHIKNVETRLKHKDVFKEFLDLAEKINKPVVIHSRDGEKHALRILELYKLKGTMHCFNGNLELLQKAQRMGLFISISTQVLYSKRVQEIAKNVDVNHILLETDSPYLGGGDRNYPWNIYNSLYKISEIKWIQPEKLAEIIAKNTQKAFPEIGEKNL